MKPKELDELSKILKANLSAMERLIFIRLKLYNDACIKSDTLGEELGISGQSVNNLLYSLRKRGLISSKIAYNHEPGRIQRTIKILTIPDRHGR